MGLARRKRSQRHFDKRSSLTLTDFAEGTLRTRILRGRRPFACRVLGSRYEVVPRIFSKTLTPSACANGVNLIRVATARVIFNFIVSLSICATNSTAPVYLPLAGSRLHWPGAACRPSAPGYLHESVPPVRRQLSFPCSVLQFHSMRGRLCAPSHHGKNCSHYFQTAAAPYSLAWLIPKTR